MPFKKYFFNCAKSWKWTMAIVSIIITSVCVLLFMCLYNYYYSSSQAEQLQKEHVLISDADQVNDKLQILKAGGAEKLQVRIVFALLPNCQIV
jgi:ribose 5-phosphate isomerase